MITLEETKKKLRETCKVKRKKTFLKNGEIFSEMISSHFINWFANQQNIKNVAFYYPINTEVDPFPIIHLLKKKSLKHCLPVICKLNAPLIFREWKKDTKLINSFNLISVLIGKLVSVILQISNLNSLAKS